MANGFNPLFGVDSSTLESAINPLALVEIQEEEKLAKKAELKKMLSFDIDEHIEKVFSPKIKNVHGKRKPVVVSPSKLRF